MDDQLTEGVGVEVRIRLTEELRHALTDSEQSIQTFLNFADNPEAVAAETEEGQLSREVANVEEPHSTGQLDHMEKSTHIWLTRKQ